MSAIAGILPLDGSAPDPGLITRMAAHLARVAPHGSRVHTEAGIGLACAHLRTGDVGEAGAPPLVGREGRWIAADARIDDRAALVQALRRAGMPAREDSPAVELILASLEAWGDSGVERLRGDFAFALWNGAERRLLLARDQFGMKPLYLAALPDALVFSTDLECVRLHPGVAASLDEEWLADFLVNGMPQSAEATVYASVRVLPPGHLLAVQDGRISRRRYWALPEQAEPLRLRDPAAYAERFRQLLGDAVRDRLPRGPAGILLSGGRDSTALAACWRDLVDLGERGPGLRAFTTGHVRLLPDDEPRFAGMVAAALDLPHEILPVDDYAPFGRWEEPSLQRPEPVDAPLLAIEADLHGMAALHGPVLLTGQGADALLRESTARLTRLAAGGHPLRAAREAAEYLWWHQRFPRPGTRTWLRERRGADPVPPPVPAWLDGSFAARVGLRDRLAEWVERRRRASLHPLHPEAHAALASAFWPVLAGIWAPSATGIPLEVRHPYFDLRLVEFVLSVPPAQWYNDKGLARIAMRGRLPRAVLRRGKTPVAGDPIRARRQALGEGWLGGRTVSPAVSPWVDLLRLPRETGGRAAGPSDRLYADLRPLALSLWLSQAGSRSTPR